MIRQGEKIKTGFLIGRFQPFHKGHLRLIKKSLEYVDKLIIGIGSIGIVDPDNFLDYEIRKKMLKLVVEKERWQDKIKKIVPLRDFNDDVLWLRHSLDMAGKFDVVIGNNEWTNGIFERAGHQVLRLGFYKRYLYEGGKIRRLMSVGGAWEERGPEYILNLIINSK